MMKTPQRTGTRPVLTYLLRHHPPGGPTNKNLCRDVSVPRLDGFSLITLKPRQTVLVRCVADDTAVTVAPVRRTDAPSDDRRAARVETACPNRQYTKIITLPENYAPRLISNFASDASGGTSRSTWQTRWTTSASRCALACCIRRAAHCTARGCSA